MEKENKFSKIKENMEGRERLTLNKAIIYKIYAKERGISIRSAKEEWKCVEETINKVLIQEKPYFNLGILTIMRKPSSSNIRHLRPKQFGNIENFYIKPYKYSVKIKRDVVKNLMEYIKKLTIKKEENADE